MIWQINDHCCYRHRRQKDAIWTGAGGDAGDGCGGSFAVFVDQIESSPSSMYQNGTDTKAECDRKELQERIKKKRNKGMLSIQFIKV